MKKNFDIIEKELKTILVALGEDFSSDERLEVNNFIDVGEYGLALSTLSDIIKEERKTIDKRIYDLIEKLKNTMAS